MLSLNISSLLRLVILMVGLHSTILGIIIYFFTVPFYNFFFSVDPDNVFFIGQAGIFLFLIGLFYLAPLFDLKKNKVAVILIIVSKITAVWFLLINDHLSPGPSIIHLAALGDALMAASITVLVWLCYRSRVFPFDP